MKMEEGRWSKICLREELRGIENRVPTKWERVLKKAFEETGDGTLIDEVKRGEMKKRLEKGIKIKRDQKIQLNWGKTDRSKCCKLCKTLKEKANMELSWEKEGGKGKFRKQ